LGGLVCMWYMTASTRTGDFSLHTAHFSSITRVSTVVTIGVGFMAITPSLAYR
jgi:hypothetical protein